MRSFLGFLPLVLWTGTATAAVPAADLLWAKGDYRGAFAQAIEPAIRGDAHAQFLIGEAYRLGRSVDPNFPQAEQWYARAAGQGDIAAATELGLLLAGQHLESAAVPWLTLAAQHGEPRALCALAAIYFNGDAVERDEARAYALMTRAAAAGLPEAQTGLATLRRLLPPEMQSRGMALIPSALPAPAPQPIAERLASAPPLSPRRAATFRVQVGAYRSAEAAERAWTTLARQIDGIRKIDHSVLRSKSMYRLQAELADATAARIFCRTLEAAGRRFLARSSARLI